MALLTNINGKFSVSDAGAVTFNNAFTFPTADGTANYVLKTNGSGQLAWAADNYENYDYWILQGDSAANVNINSTNTLKFVGGTYIDTSATWAGGSNPRKLTINHETTSRTDTTSTDEPAFGGTFEAVTSVSTNSTGHVTAIDVSTITIPTDPGGTVKGTGTATRVAFWSASDTITSDADLYWDNTNNRLGIGTASPTNPLSVEATNVSDWVAEFKQGYSTAGQSYGVNIFGGTNSSDAAFQVCNQAGSGLLRVTGAGEITNTMSGGKVLTDTNGFITSFQTLDLATAGGRYMGKSNRGLLGRIRIEQTATGADGGYISFDTSPSGSTTPTPKMRVNSSGSVGIGFTDPGNYKLKVNGAISGTNIYANSAGGSFVFGASTSEGEYITRPNATNDICIVAGGNVGIGITGPENKLHILTSTTDTSSQLMVQNGSTGDAAIKFNISGQSYVIGIDNSDSNKFKISGSSALGTTDRLVVDGSGNVGIGVDPSGNTDRLQIDNPANPTSIRIGDNTTDDCYIVFNTDGNDWSIGTDRSDSNKFKISDYSRVGTNDRLVIDGNGNVGIGTAFPSYYLDVKGPDTNNAVIARFYSNTGARGSFIIRNGSGTNPTTFIGTAGGGEQLSIGTNGTEALRIDASQKVGIGTDSPNKRLTIGGVNTTEGVNLYTKVGSTLYKLWEVEQYFSDEGYQGMYYQNVKKIQFRTNGDSYLNGGNVGIGVTGPSSKFEVQGAPANGVYLSYLYNSATHNSAHGLNVQTTTNNILTYGLRVNTGGDSNALAVMGNGTVGIGTSSPSYKLDVDGTIRATGDVIAYSDVRVKENIKTIDNSLEKVSKLRGVEFNKIGDDEKSIGVIAQEIEKVVPEVVKEDDKGMKSVAYGNISGLLIEAIKELKAEIEELKLNKCNCNK